MDQIFLPGGLAADPSGNWLYVINSNNDLRFNAGTVLALDLNKAKTHRDMFDPQKAANHPEIPAIRACSTSKFIDGKTPETLAEAVKQQPCCVDYLKPHLINCSERAYVRADATVRVGSFGGEAVMQTYQKESGESVHRLFFGVRSDPSITFIDISQTAEALSMRCSGARDQDMPNAPNPSCDDHWRVRRPGGSDVGDNVLPEEPHSLVLDEKLGILYVSHLAISVRGTPQGGGVSTIDIDSLRDPRGSNTINSIARVPFPAGTSQGVVSLSLSEPGNPDGVLFAVSRSGPDIAGLMLQCQQPGQHCDEENPSLRDLSMVPGEQIKSSAFWPSGTNVRGFLLSSDGQQAYVLHRNSPEDSTSTNPAALVVLDRRSGANGEPTNQTSAILEVCPGPAELHVHDAGRGRMLYITCFEAGQIYVVDPQDPQVVARIEAGHGPKALSFSSADPTVAYFAAYDDNNVAILDLQPGSPTEYMVVQRIGFPHAVTE